MGVLEGNSSREAGPLQESRRGVSLSYSFPPPYHSIGPIAGGWGVILGWEPFPFQYRG
jgi:hypothetical protein